MPDEPGSAQEQVTTTTTVEVVKQNWSPEQIDACLAHHSLPDDADLTPEHFAQAGMDTPDGGTEVHTFTLTEGPQA